MSTITAHGWRRALYNHPVLLIAGFFLAGLLLVAVGALYADEREERNFVLYSERLMQTFVEQQQHELERIIRDYAIWDEMAERVHGETSDDEWLRKNLTESVYRNLNINDALVLSAGLRPLFYLYRGEPVTLAKLADWNPEFAESLSRSIAMQPGLSSLSGVVRTNGMLQFLVAERIRPEHVGGVRELRSGWIIYTRNLDPSWLEDTSRLLAIKEIGVENTQPQAKVPHFPLLGIDHQQVAGWLSWQVDRRQSGGGSVQPLLFSLFVLFVFVVLLARAVLKMHTRQSRIQARMLHQSETLRRLAHLPHSSEDEARYLQDIAEAVRKTLEATRVTIWRHDSRHGSFRCVASGGDTAALERLLDVSAHADYFRQLTEQRTLAADDVAADSRQRSLSACRKEQGFAAALDAAVMIRGRLSGMLSVEMAGQSQPWEQDQIGFAAAAADLVALVYESAERHRTEAALHRQQFYDTLTGLPNQERLGQLLQQHLLQPGIRLVFSLWNVGGMFHINEELGRANGDLILQEIARRLERVSGEHVAARLAGNRFVLVLLNVSAPLVSQELERVYYQLLEPVVLAEHAITPQLSCGVSLAPQDAFTVEELLRHAEFALEVARSRSGIPMEFYAPEPNAVARERYQLAGALPAALIRGEFELNFQPFVDLNSRELLGAEALLRWHHQEKGLINPDQFIPIAEETGQIHALGRFVLEDACRRMRVWREKTGKPLLIAINVSPLQLHDPGFISFVEKVLEEQQTAPELLELEITESTSIELLEHIPETLRRLREMGVRLSIDDFGTGYSSLTNLRHMPVNKLKIDRSFIENIPQNKQDADLTRMTINLGRILGMTIVAEGIETEAQLEFLREQGCHIGQGFLFSRPVNASTFDLILERGLH